MSERPDHKAWSAAVSEAHAFFVEHGGDEMSADDRHLYEQLVEDIQDKANLHGKSRKNL